MLSNRQQQLFLTHLAKLGRAMVACWLSVVGLFLAVSCLITTAPWQFTIKASSTAFFEFLWLSSHIARLTSLQVLFLRFAAHAVDAGHRLHVTLVDGWWVQYGLWSSSQANWQTCSAHQDTCHTWRINGTQMYTEEGEKNSKFPLVEVSFKK